MLMSHPFCLVIYLSVSRTLARIIMTVIWTFLFPLHVEKSPNVNPKNIPNFILCSLKYDGRFVMIRIVIIFVEYLQQLLELRAAIEKIRPPLHTQPYTHQIRLLYIFSQSSRIEQRERVKVYSLIPLSVQYKLIK